MDGTSPVFTAIIAQLLYYGEVSATLAAGGLAIGAIPLTLTLHKGPSACSADGHELGMAVVFAAAAVVTSLLARMLTSWAKVQSTILFGEDSDAQLRRRTPQTAIVRRALVLVKAVLVVSLTLAALTMFFVVQAKTMKIGCMGTAAQIATYLLVPLPALFISPLLFTTGQWTLARPPV